jgi:hypothetical protein
MADRSALISLMQILFKPDVEAEWEKERVGVILGVLAHTLE